MSDDCLFDTTLQLLMLVCVQSKQQNKRWTYLCNTLKRPSFVSMQAYVNEIAVRTFRFLLPFLAPSCFCLQSQHLTLLQLNPLLFSHMPPASQAARGRRLSGVHGLCCSTVQPRAGQDWWRHARCCRLPRKQRIGKMEISDVHVVYMCLWG